MNKRGLQILERVFIAEVENRLPFQSKSKQVQRLVDEGYIEPMTRSFGRDRFGEISATGYALTHAGRITYCESCKDPEVNGGEKESA